MDLFIFLLFIIGLFFIHDYALCIYHPTVFLPFIRSFGDHLIEWIALDLPLQLTSFKNCRFPLW